MDMSDENKLYKTVDVISRIKTTSRSKSLPNNALFMRIMRMYFELKGKLLPQQSEEVARIISLQKTRFTIKREKLKFLQELMKEQK